MRKTGILYLSLTGMTEPLGRSQVLEYLIELSKENRIYLISFERIDDLSNVNQIQTLVDTNNIEWIYLIYSNKYGIFSSLVQIVQAIRSGSILIKRHEIDIVHARSMIPATMGLLLKKMYKVKLLFDIRGFAIDEKVDSNRLKKRSLLFKILKKLDDYLYQVFDHVVTLTYAAKEILHKNLNISNDKITVIPTCASKQVFSVMNEKDKQEFKVSQGYTKEDEIIIHTGTVSGWYDFESEVILVKELVKKDLNLHFLILNKNDLPYIQKVLAKHDFPFDKVKVMSTSFDEVYKYLNIAFFSIFFIKPSYSKQASAPTKFAENIACHLPSITNLGVGDMAFYLNKYDVGYLVDLDKLNTNLDGIALKITSYLNKNNNNDNSPVYDELFEHYFDKNIAITKYHDIYKQL